MSEFATKDTRFYVRQADVTLNQATPSTGVKYTLLSETSYVRLITANCKVTWSVQPSPLELWVTIDGIETKHSKSDPVSATSYGASLRDDTASTGELLVTGGTENVRRAFLCEGKVVSVQAETTGGTSNPLESRIKYSRYI